MPSHSRRARGQREFLLTLGEDPELAQLRADRLRNVAEIARVLARYASWADRTTRPTRARICRLARVGVSTWKTARRWLEEHGYLGTVREGWTPALRAAALVSPEDPNSAAVYVLCVPRRRPRTEPIVAGQAETRPLTTSRSDGVISPARDARKIKGGKAAARAASRYPAQVTELRKGPGQKLTDERVASIGRPFLAAGWSPADIRHAIHHDPDGGVHHGWIRYVASPAHWLAWRLSRWTTEPDVAWQAFRELGRWAHLPAPIPVASPSLRQWDGVTPVGQVYVERNRAKAAAAKAHGPSAAWREARAALERRRTKRIEIDGLQLSAD